LNSQLAGTVINKVGEEINENFATKTNGKPRARTTVRKKKALLIQKNLIYSNIILFFQELANTLEKVGKSLITAADLEDIVNYQFEKIKYVEE
jgi:hypothetical protein